ncbi:DMT family transporter [Pseudotabrizicola algicola]|uniref:DMT family transporter n=1 Tax=Pseudotabrizicola algicola TaxID=2709381 RepID=A0A6B3RKW2_9RHOB|nr:DMT family transporter [Pseudotabrizicola algicola]NEX46061.1 DMT family transporter [Pseudotabrizicola algicola]
MGHNLKGALYALLAFAIYATHDVVIKFLGESYNSFQIIFFSGLLGFPLITFMLMSDRTDGNLIPRHPWWSLLRSLTAVSTGAAGFYAFTVLPLAQTYAILFAMPLLITVLAIPMLGEKVGLRRGIAVVVGLLGVLIVLRPGSAELSWGHLAALSAALTGSLTSVIVRKIGGEERSAVLMLYPMVATFLLTGAAMPFVYVPMPLEHLALTGVIALMAFVAAMLSIAAYRTAPAIIVAPMQYSQIIWAVIYGALLFDEQADAYTLVGTGVIIASGIYIVMREGTGSVSKNSPVLSNKSRPETGLMPRISLLLKRGERRRSE